MFPTPRFTTSWFGRHRAGSRRPGPGVTAGAAPGGSKRLEDRTLLSTAFTVDSNGDADQGSGNSGDLRYVINQVNGLVPTTGDATITFFSVTGPITLDSALPDLTYTGGLIDVEGPGAASLTVARNSAAGTPDFRIFTIDTNTHIKMVGLTITGGLAAAGGGLLIDGGTVSLTKVTVTQNQAVGTAGAAGASGGNAHGGGIYLNGGSLTLNHDLVRSNVARGGDGGPSGDGGFSGSGGGGAGGSAAGGGAYLANGTLLLSNDTFELNQAVGGAGGRGGDAPRSGFFTGGPGGVGGAGGPGRGAACTSAAARSP